MHIKKHEIVAAKITFVVRIFRHNIGNMITIFVVNRYFSLRFAKDADRNGLPVVKIKIAAVGADIARAVRFTKQRFFVGGQIEALHNIFTV